MVGDNEVHVYRLDPKIDMRATVYTRYNAFDSDENKIERAYFTKEKIAELKEELIKKIQNMDNPFEIYCIDTDGNYNITDGDIFDENNQDYKPTNIQFCD